MNYEGRCLKRHAKYKDLRCVLDPNHVRPCLCIPVNVFTGPTERFTEREDQCKVCALAVTDGHQICSFCVAASRTS
jgi:hypothetical protein